LSDRKLLAARPRGEPACSTRAPTILLGRPATGPVGHLVRPDRNRLGRCGGARARLVRPLGSWPPTYPPRMSAVLLDTAVSRKLPSLRVRSLSLRAEM